MADVEVLQRFQREAETVARLHSRPYALGPGPGRIARKGVRNLFQDEKGS